MTETNTNTWPRIHTTSYLIVGATGILSAFVLVKWMNSIPNTLQSQEQWGSSLAALSLLLGVAIIAAGTVAVFTGVKASRLAGAVTMAVTGIMLFTFLLAPFLGLLALLIINGYPLILPAAFFGAALLRCALNAWNSSDSTRGDSIAAAISCVGFVCCIHFALVFNKYLALGWAQAMD